MVGEYPIHALGEYTIMSAERELYTVSFMGKEWLAVYTVNGFCIFCDCHMTLMCLIHVNNNYNCYMNKYHNFIGDKKKILFHDV